MKHGKKKSSKSSKKYKKSDRKEKKLKKKEKIKRDKKMAKALKAIKEAPVSDDKDCSKTDPVEMEHEFCGPSIDLMNRAKCPETKAEYDHRQSQIKRVVDPETGRIRLIKGDGEILEEIVTRDRHKQINQDATRGDGQSFQRNTVGAIRK